MPTLDKLAYYVTELGLLVALATLVLGIVLLRRGTDRAVWFLIGWSALRLVLDAWWLWVTWYFAYGTDRFPPPGWVDAVSSLGIILGQLFVYCAVGYAVHRFWRAHQTRKG